MKRIFLLISAMILAGTMAFGQNVANKQNKNLNRMNRKTLVVFFTATGTTITPAKMICTATEADYCEIVPTAYYTKEDLDWTNKKSRSSVEMNDPKARPAMRPLDLNPESYDVIYVGFPIWWYTAPRIINTFMESYKLKGKTVIPFATSGGSSITKACEDLKAAYPDVNWKPGRLLNDPSPEEIDAFVSEN